MMSNGLTAQIILSFDPTRSDEAADLLDSFSGILRVLQKNGVAATIMSPAPGPAGPDDEPLPLGADPDDPPPAPVAGAVNKRVRDRTAERRAAKEKAEAEAKARSRGNGAEEDDPLLGAGAGPGTGDPFGDDVEDQPASAAKPAEPGTASATPKECMDGAVVLLRQTWGGGPAAVDRGEGAAKNLDQVAKFADVPLDKAPGLWKEAASRWLRSSTGERSRRGSESHRWYTLMEEDMLPAHSRTWARRGCETLGALSR